MHSKIEVRKNTKANIAPNTVIERKAFDPCLLSHAEEALALLILYHQYGLVLIKKNQGYEIYQRLRD